MPPSMASMSEKSLTVQGKSVPSAVTGPAQKERSRGQIDHAPDAELSPHRLQARDPHSCGLLVLLRLRAVVALQGAFLVLLGRLLAVAVVGLVVEHQDVLHAHEVRHHPLEHLARGLAGRDVRTSALEEGAASLRDGEGLALHEGVVVGDDDLGAVEVAEHVGRHQLAALVVAVRVVRLEHPQAVADGEARGDHQESAREPPAAGTAHRVDGLPRNEHGHDRGLAGAGRELEREPGEAGVRLLVRRREMIEESAALVAECRRDLGQPDRGLRRFDLAEEGPDVVEPVVAPMLQEPSRLGSHPPPARVRNRPPRIDLTPESVDDLHQLVLLAVCLQRLRRLVEVHLALSALLGLRNRGDERDAAAVIEDAARGLAALVEFPVPRRVLVGGVEDGAVEEAVAHGGASLS